MRKQLLFFANCCIMYRHLGVAQFGSALDWGSRCRRFKSCHSDQCKEHKYCAPFSFARAVFTGIAKIVKIEYNKHTIKRYI